MTAVHRGVRLAAFLVLILIVAGCAAAPPPALEPTAPPTPEPQPTVTAPRLAKLTLAAGSPEDDGYPLGVALGTAVTETMPDMEMSVKKTDSLMDSVKLLLNGQGDLAFVYDYHVVFANQGTLAKAFPDAPPETLHIKCGVEVTRPAFPDYGQAARVVLPLYEQPLHLVTTATGDIAGLNDLRGKRVSIGPPGSISAELAGYVLEALAFDMAHDTALEQWSVTESMAALDKGELDAFFWAGPVPNPDLVHLFAASPQKIVILPITGDDAGQIMQAQPGIFHQRQIPAQTYPNLAADVDTLAVTLVLAAMEDLPPDQVTQIVRLVESQPERFAALDRPLTPEMSISHLGAEAQPYLHQGSAAFFED